MLFIVTDKHGKVSKKGLLKKIKSREFSITLAYFWMCDFTSFNNTNK